MHERKNVVFISFIDLGNREVLWQVLKMYDVEGIHLSGIKSTNIRSSACVRVKWGQSKLFRIGE